MGVNKMKNKRVENENCKAKKGFCRHLFNLVKHHTMLYNVTTGISFSYICVLYNYFRDFSLCMYNHNHCTMYIMIVMNRKHELYLYTYITCYCYVAIPTIVMVLPHFRTCFYKMEFIIYENLNVSYYWQ